jgi:hypothetical protein
MLLSRPSHDRRADRSALLPILGVNCAYLSEIAHAPRHSFDSARQELAQLNLQLIEVTATDMDRKR